MPHAYIDTIAMIVMIFRPFPSFADLSVLICLGNSHPRVLGRMDWLTFITFGIGVPMFMIPAMLHVWLMAGTANANYLYVYGGGTLLLFCVLLSCYCVLLSLLIDFRFVLFLYPLTDVIGFSRPLLITYSCA